MNQRAAAVAPAPAKTAVARAAAPQPKAESPLADFGAAGEEHPQLQRLPANAAGGFATLPAGAVIDVDAVRRLATQRLLEQLAPALGLDLGRLRIEIHAAGRARLDAAGARGLQEGSTIWLHPAHYRPQDAEGRYLLAHEATHAAQRRLPGPGDEAAAEGEALALGREFAAGRLPRRPRIALAGTRAAADAGSKDATAAAETGAKETSAAADAGAAAKPPAAVSVDLVKSARGQDLAVMLDALDGLWVSDGDVFDLLAVMEPLPFPTQVVMVQALHPKYARRLADNVSDVHFKRYRTSVLAAYLAVVRSRQTDALADDPFAGMDWSALVPEEHHALREIIPAFRALPKGAHWYAGLQARHLLDFVGDVLGRVPGYNEAEQSSKAAQQEQLRVQQIEENRKQVQRKDLAAFLDEARDKLSYKPLDWAVTDADARSLIDGVSAYVAQPAALRAIVDTLEGEGLMDRWVSNLPVSDLYTDAPVATTAGAGSALSRRKVLLQVLVLRPAWKNARMADALLSYGLFDWAITDEDAFLAAQLVKALPQRVREGFYAEGDHASRLDEEQSRSMKKGRAANNYGGGEDGKDLHSIQAQLLDDTLWSVAQTSRLRQLIQMARAADEGRWVFELSRQRFEQPGSTMPALYADHDFFDRVVQAFQLFVPKGFRRPDGGVDAGRTAYLPEQLEGKPFGSDNVFASIGRYARYLASHSGRIDIRIHGLGLSSVRGSGLDFAEAQETQGGSLAGVEFVPAGGAAREEQLQNSLQWFQRAGILHMFAARLDIASINYPMANLKVQTGAATLQGLRLYLEYPTEHSQHKTTTLMLHVERLQLEDLLMVGADSMRGFERVTVRDFFLRLAPDSGAAQIATLPDSLASGATALLKQGLLAPTTPLNLVATAGEVLLQGMTTSDGQFVAQIKLDDLVLRATAARPAGASYRKWLGEERARLQARLLASHRPVPAGALLPHVAGFESTHSLELQLQSVEHEMQGLSEAEAEASRLAPLVQAGKAGAADTARYKRVQSYLAGVESGGVAFDLGHGEARGIAGKVAMGDVSLDDVHGWGHSAGAVLGTLSGSGTVNRMMRGPGYRGTLQGVELEGDPAGFVKLGDIQLAAVNVQGDIRTSDAAAKDLAQAQAAAQKNPYDPRLADEVMRLAARAEHAATYWATLQKPAIDAADRQKFNAARTALLADRAFHADSITAKGVVLDLARQGSGGIGVGIDTRSFEARGLDAGAVRVDTVSGDNLRLGADVSGGLQALIALGKNRHSLQGASVSADSLRIGGVAHKYSGVRIEEALFRNLDAHAGFEKGQSTLDVAATSIDVRGVNWALSERVLEMQRAKLGERPVEQLNKAEKAQLTDIDFLLGAIKESKQRLADAARQLMDPGLSAETKRDYEDQKRDAEAELAHWEKKVELKHLTVRDLSLKVQGLGDLLADDYSLDRAMGTGEGVKIGSQRADGRITSGVSAQGAWMRTSAGSIKDTAAGTLVTANGQVGADSIETGPISGSLTLAAGHVSLDGFGIESLVVHGLRYFGGNHSLWSDGQAPSTVSGVKISATLETPLVDEKQPDGERYAAAITITRLDIAEVAGAGLHYRNHKSGLRADVSSGKLLKIYADTMRIDLPRTDKDKLRITGQAGLAGAEAVRVAATTGSGMALSSTLDAGKLDVGFASDGTVTADLASLHARGQLKQKDLDLEFNARSSGLHLSLDADMDPTRFSADDTDVKLSGTKGKTVFKAEASHISTGEITIDKKTNMISAPNLRLPSVKISRLHLQGATYMLDVPEGQITELKDAALHLEIESNPAPKGDESPMKKIFIRELHVPKVALRGANVTLIDEDGDDSVLTLPSGVAGSIDNLRIKPTADRADAFTVIPDKDWAMVGGLGFDTAKLAGVGAHLPGLLDATADIEATGFSMGFLSDGNKVIDLDKIKASEISGQILGSKFSLMKSKTRHGNAGVVVTGFHKDKDGITLKELGVDGFVYEDTGLGLTLDIQSASLTGKGGGLQIPGKGPLRIPHLAITNAYFRIDDLMAMGSGGSSGTPSTIHADTLNFLDTLHGDIDLVIHADANYARKLATDFPLDIHIENGQIDYAQVESQLFSNSRILQQAIDFEYDDGRLFVQLDLKTLAIVVGGPLGAAASRELYGWDLEANDNGIDERKLAEAKRVRLKSLARPFLPDGTKGSGGSSAAGGSINDLNVVVRAITLGLKGQSVVDLANLNKSGLQGKIRLGAPGLDAVTGLTVSGDMKAGFKLGLAGANASVDGLAIKGDEKASKKRDGVTTRSDVKVNTGTIHIGALSNTSLGFANGGSSFKHLQIFPKTLEGTVSSATAEDIEVTTTTTKTGVPETGAKTP